MDIKNRKINFVVKENTYELTHPTVGQYFDIESQKAFLSKGQYGAMLDSGTKVAWAAIELINIVSIMKVLCPQFTKELKIDRIEDIDVLDFKEIRDAYNEQVKPWYENWYDLYSGEGKVEENK